MRTSNKVSTDLMVGYSHLWLDARTSLLVPQAVADEKAQAQEKSAANGAFNAPDAAQRHRQQVMAEELRKAKAKKAQDRARRKALHSEPRAGWHRVLPGLAELEQELQAPGDRYRSADKDVNERRKRIIEQLFERGPDRRVAVPANWREAVDGLEAALPHFRKPIRLVRNALALAEATGMPPRIAPQLLLGPPGVGKTYFTHQLASLLGSTQAAVQFDQPGGGSQLRGSDKYWANSEHGLLFKLICMGEVANPVVLLDELDKAADPGRRNGEDQLAQLHSALEPETSRRLKDVSLDIEFDASLTVYVATANSLIGVGAPIVSRMEVSVIEPPGKWESFEIAQGIAQSVLQRFKLDGQIRFERGALAVLGQLSPRRMVRAAEQALAAAVVAGRSRIGDDEVWSEVAGGADPMLH